MRVTTRGYDTCAVVGMMGGGGEVVTIVVPNDRDKENARASYSLSEKYQWLPAEFILAEKQYTYNQFVHQHNLAFKVCTLTCITPSATLSRSACLCSSVVSPDLRQYSLAARHWDSPMNCETAHDVWQNRPREHRGDKRVCKTSSSSSCNEGRDDDSLSTISNDACDEWCANNVTPVSRETGTHKRQETPPHVKLRGRTLKVIVKLANIALTPEKPDNNGGAWHVEGMGNEAIVATVIYYFSQ